MTEKKANITQDEFERLCNIITDFTQYVLNLDGVTCIEKILKGEDTDSAIGSLEILFDTMDVQRDGLLEDLRNRKNEIQSLKDELAKRDIKFELCEGLLNDSNIDDEFKAKLVLHVMKESSLSDFVKSEIMTQKPHLVLVTYGSQKINAIKFVRERYGVGLKEAKELVEKTDMGKLILEKNVTVGEFQKVRQSLSGSTIVVEHSFNGTGDGMKPRCSVGW